MTVSSGYAPNSSTANGVTTVFPYNFLILVAADLEVTVDGVVKTLTTDYSVSGVGAGSGGNVTFVVAPANGTTVIRRRNMALARTTDYQDNGDLLADVLNPDQDAPVLMIQQLQEQVSRSLKVPVGDSGGVTLPAASGRAGKALVFDGSGNAGVTDNNFAALAAAAAASSASASGFASAASSSAALAASLEAQAAAIVLGNFLQSGTGAVARTFTSKAREVFSVKDFGAVGDGVTNDTVAMQRVAAAINANGGGQIYFPPGTYIVGSQTFGGGVNAYAAANILVLVGCTKPVVIEGYGAVLKIADGLKFGSFNPSTGVVFNPPGGGFIDNTYAAIVGNVIQVKGCRNKVVIRGLEIDGNNTKLVLGGYWGDTGIQLAASGILNGGFTVGDHNTDVSIEDCYIHHCGLDGLVDAAPGFTNATQRYPHVLKNVRCEYNGRQGLSWVGGTSLTAIDCVFNKTGRAVNVGTGSVLASAPGAGVDIEAESSVCRNGAFINCEFSDNFGVGLISDNVDAADMLFVGCKFIGTTSWSLWPKAPRFRFESCLIVGSMTQPFLSSDPSLATKFHYCRLSHETALSPTGVVYGTRHELDFSDNVEFSDCHVNAGAVALPFSVAATIWRNCSFKQSSASTSFVRGLFFGRNSFSYTGGGSNDFTFSTIYDYLLVNGVRQDYATTFTGLTTGSGTPGSVTGTWNRTNSGVVHFTLTLTWDVNANAGAAADIRGLPFTFNAGGGAVMLWTDYGSTPFAAGLAGANTLRLYSPTTGVALNCANVSGKTFQLMGVAYT